MATKNPIRIESKIMFINIEFDIKTINVNTTVLKQICVYKNEDGTLGYDVDTMEYKNLEVMGNKISNDFRERDTSIEHLKNAGIDIIKMIEDASQEVLTPARIKNILKTVNLD